MSVLTVSTGTVNSSARNRNDYMLCARARNPCADSWLSKVGFNEGSKEELSIESLGQENIV